MRSVMIDILIIFVNTPMINADDILPKRTLNKNMTDTGRYK